METLLGFELASPRDSVGSALQEPPELPLPWLLAEQQCPGDTRTSADVPSDGGDHLPRVTSQ